MMSAQHLKDWVRDYFEDIDAPWYALPLVVSVVVVLHLAFSHITLSPYESVKPSLLWKISRAPETGDYVTFKHSHPLITQKAEAWIKVLACKEGQLLQRIDDRFYCDGQFFAKARFKSKANRDLPQFYFEGIIPNNKAFVLGDGRNSFDSRHFGFVDYDIMTTNIELLPGPFASSAKAE